MGQPSLDDARRAVPPRPTLVVAGERLVAGSGGETSHHEPATGRALPAVPLAGAAEVAHAVAAARRALPMWRRIEPPARRAHLMALADALDADAEGLALVSALELGQPFAGQLAAARLAAEHYRYFAGWVDKLEGRVVPAYPGPSLDYTRREPVGVVAGIVPWNGPVVATALKLAPALAAGNCAVIKASEVAPFAALRLAEVIESVGLPTGVVTVVPGGPDAGEALVRADVDLVSFTGGVPTSRRVLAAAAVRGTPVVAELGGKSALLAFADADPRKVATLAVRHGIAQTSGQGCFLPTRVLVDRTRRDDVVAAITAAARDLVLGGPFDDGTTMGPVVSAGARDRVLGVIAHAHAQGATLTAGGTAPTDRAGDGFFVEPTVFADVDPASDLAQEEVFGPVLAISTFGDEDEAVALANGTRYGLGAYIVTDDVTRAHRVAAAVEAGYVSINGMAFLPPAAPFGGVKDSGFGREGGAAALEAMTTTKNVYLSLR